MPAAGLLSSRAPNSIPHRTSPTAVIQGARRRRFEIGTRLRVDSQEIDLLFRPRRLPVGSCRRIERARSGVTPGIV